MSGRGFSGNEKCIFCGWTRRTAYQSVRFFCIPKDPGLKRVRWLHVFGDRDVTAKDRVCSVHFRQGRPSSDPSHEDFVPHLYLNNEPPPEVLDYLESLADSKLEKVPVPADYSSKAQSSSTRNSNNSNQTKEQKAEINNRNPKPSILKRKRPKTERLAGQEAQEQLEPQNIDEDEFNNSNSLSDHNDFENQDDDHPVKLTLVQQQIADAVGLKPGQTVIVRRRIIKK